MVELGGGRTLVAGSGADDSARRVAGDDGAALGCVGSDLRRALPCLVATSERLIIPQSRRKSRNGANF